MVTCPICHGDQAAVFTDRPVDREYFNVRSNPASILRCAHCQSLFQSPWPSHDEVGSFYAEDYQNYSESTAPFFSALYAAYNCRIGKAHVSRHGTEAAVLDFGCGHGDFLRSLHAAGCRQLCGYDVVRYDGLDRLPDVRFVDELGALVETGKRFDVIRMNHVIEHLVDVDSTVSQLAELLTPSGRIIGQTPNAAHYTSRLMGTFWGPLHYPCHTALFSQQGIALAAERWGLRLVGTRGTLLPTGWALSAENFVKAMFGSTRRGRTPLYVAYMLASMPFASFDRWLAPGETANFDFVLKRRP